jgi:hypothetical protein
MAMNFQRIEEQAGQIQKSMKLDPATILVIVQAIVAVLSALLECQKNKVSWRRYIKLSFGKRWARRELREILHEAENVGPDKLEELLGGSKFIDEILARGEILTDEDILQMMGDPQ